jgi:hypothetical protein
MEYGIVQADHEAHQSADSQRGVAMIISIMVMLVVSLLAMGLIGQSMLGAKLSGTERWMVKTFYAADSGLNVAQTRARIQELDGVGFSLSDLRTTTGPAVSSIDVVVDPLLPIGAPRMVIGSSANGGQGSDTTLIIQSYRTRSTAAHQLSNSERAVEVIFGLGPMPATIPE